MAYDRTMANDGQAPATKEDIRRVEEGMAAMEERLMRHFDLTVETIRHDLLGANKDRIELHRDKLTDHEGRLVRLERHAGLPS